jgi:hypothetical protein
MVSGVVSLSPPPEEIVKLRELIGSHAEVHQAALQRLGRVQGVRKSSRASECDRNRDWLRHQHQGQPDQVSEWVLVPTVAAYGSAISELVMIWACERMALPAVQAQNQLVLSAMLPHGQSTLHRLGLCKRRDGE